MMVLRVGGVSKSLLGKENSSLVDGLMNAVIVDASFWWEDKSLVPLILTLTLATGCLLLCHDAARTLSFDATLFLSRTLSQINFHGLWSTWPVMFCYGSSKWTKTHGVFILIFYVSVMDYTKGQPATAFRPNLSHCLHWNTILTLICCLWLWSVKQVQHEEIISPCALYSTTCTNLVRKQIM